MDKEFYRKSLNKRVAIGVDHHTQQGRLFWLFGTLLEVTREGLVITSRDGFIRIDFDSIKAFHLEKGKGY